MELEQHSPPSIIEAKSELLNFNLVDNCDLDVCNLWIGAAGAGPLSLEDFCHEESTQRLFLQVAEVGVCDKQPILAGRGDSPRLLVIVPKSFIELNANWIESFSQVTAAWQGPEGVGLYLPPEVYNKKDTLSLMRDLVQTYHHSLGKNSFYFLRGSRDYNESINLILGLKHYFKDLYLFH